MDFVANISIEEDSNMQNITNKNRCWIGKQDISLVPLFEVNVYSINFSAVNNIKNSSIPKLSGLKSSTSTDEYNGQSVLLSFEYNSQSIFNTNDIQTREVVNIPLAESEGFKFLGWKLNNGEYLFNEKGEISKNLVNYVSDGKFIATNNIELISVFEEV